MENFDLLPEKAKNFHRNTPIHRRNLLLLIENKPAKIHQILKHAYCKGAKMKEMKLLNDLISAVQDELVFRAMGG